MRLPTIPTSTAPTTVSLTCVPAAAGKSNVTVQAPVDATTHLFVARLLATTTPSGGCRLLILDDGDAHASPVMLHDLTFGDVLLCLGGRGMALPVSQASTMPPAPALPHQVSYFSASAGRWVPAFGNASSAGQRPALCVATGAMLLSAAATNPPSWDSGRWPSNTVGLLPLIDVEAGLQEWAAPAAITACLSSSGTAEAISANASAAYMALIEPLQLLHFRAAIFDLAGPPLASPQAPRNASQVACLLQETVHSWRATSAFGDFPVLLSDLAGRLPTTATGDSGARGAQHTRSDDSDDNNDAPLAAARAGFGTLAPSRSIQLTAVLPAADLAPADADAWAVGDKVSQGGRAAAAIMHISTGYLPPAVNASGPRPYNASRHTSGSSSSSTIVVVAMAADGWLDPDGGDPASGRSLQLTGNATACAAAWQGLTGQSWQPATNAAVTGAAADCVSLTFDVAPSAVRYGALAQQPCLLRSVATGLPAASFQVAVMTESAGPGRAGAARPAPDNDGRLALIEPSLSSAQNATPIAQTPPMGWETWNAVHAIFGEGTIRQMADALNRTGLTAHYRYLIIDEWASKQRHPRTGKLVPNPARFPSGMASLAAYVQSCGLELGIYTTQGQFTCQRYASSCGHEAQDAATFVGEWGATYVFVDGCGGCQAGEEWELWHAALVHEGAALGRPPAILEVNGCSSAAAPCAKAANLYTNLFRIGSDLQFDFGSITAHIDEQAGMQTVSGPGSWAFADMLELETPTLTLDEQAAEFLMWAFFPTPLILGMDIRTLDTPTRNLVLAPEVLAVNQDPLAVPARRLRGGPSAHTGETDLWTRPLASAGGLDAAQDVGAALFNRWPAASRVHLAWADLGLTPTQPAAVRDVYAQRALGVFTGGLNITVPAHAAVILRITPQQTEA